MLDDIIRLSGQVQEGIDTAHMVLRNGKRIAKEGRDILEKANSVYEEIVGKSGYRVKRTLGSGNGRMDSGTPKKKFKLPDMPLNLTLEQRKQTNLQALCWTWYQYKCLPQLYNTGAVGAGTPNVYRTGYGYGPGLFWTTDETTWVYNGTGVSQYPYDDAFKLHPWLDNPDPASSPFSKSGIVYIFSADWIGSVMNTDPVLRSGSKPLLWKSVTDTATTDPNNKIEIGNIIGVDGNKDWSSLTHFATHLNFQFTNLCPFTMIVEVLFFKWMVDPHDLDYKSMCLAPMSNQEDMQSYCDMNSKNFGSQQIRVIRRKRFVIKGIENQTQMGGVNRLIPYGNSNVKNYSTKIARKYTINRPIQRGTTQDTNDETTFYDKYYIAEQGVFCRMQAWPQNPLFYYDTTDPAALYPQLDNSFDRSATGQIPGDNKIELAPRVFVEMEKKSYFKFDKPILKGPFYT